MPVESQLAYQPGVCNIGKAEIQRRKRLGWAALVVTAVAWAALAVFATPASWRLLLFFPAAFATSGFLQAGWRFCAAYGLLGIFNLVKDVGETDTVDQANYRKQDRRKALLIIGWSGLSGIVVAMAAYLL